jgi:ribosomal protein S18 acetylase RimI-like enzyme
MIEVRNFKYEDVIALSSIYLNSRIETFYWISKGEFRLDDFVKDTDGEKILVAERDGEIAGFISLWIVDNFVHHLFVRADFQGLGIGERLLDEGLKTISRPARLKCVVRNAKACAFYEKRGWSVEGTAADGPMGPYRTYALSK